MCIDIGGTMIKYGVVDDGGNFLWTAACETNASAGGAAIMHKVTELIRQVKESDRPIGVCVSTAGMVDCERGIITYAAPLIPGYTGTNVKEIIREHCGLPCEVENDVNCAGIAEYFAGAARGTTSSLCLTIGTGIGGSMIVDGHVWRGFSGSACEIGYMHLPGGMFQDLASSRSLVDTVIKRRQSDGERIDGRYIFEQAKRGDSICICALEEMADILGMGIANLCYMFNPEIVVLGGGIMEREAEWRPMLTRSLSTYLLPTVREHTKVAFAKNGNLAGMLGAYYHYRQRNDDENDDEKQS